MAFERVDPAELVRQGRIEEFLIELRRSAEDAAAEAAALPQWDALAVELLAFWQTAHATLFEGDHHPLIPLRLRDPAPGSRLTQEAAALGGRQLNDSHVLLFSQIASYAAFISDQLRGLAAVMLADPPVRPALVLARVLLDAAAQLRYLIDPDISAVERSARSANIRLVGLHAEIRDIDPPEADDDARSRLQAEIDDILRRGDADSLPRLVSKKGVEQPYFLPAPVSAQEMSSLLMGDLGRRSWRVLSSVVHAQDRSVVQFTSGRGRFGQEVHGRKYAALDVAPSVVVTSEVCLALSRALGLSVGTLEMHSRALTSLWARAAGIQSR